MFPTVSVFVCLSTERVCVRERKIKQPLHHVSYGIYISLIECVCERETKKTKFVSVCV